MDHRVGAMLELGIDPLSNDCHDVIQRSDPECGFGTRSSNREMFPR